MSKNFAISMTAVAMTFGAVAYAEAPTHPIDDIKHMQHMEQAASFGGDTRQEVNFPPEMRQHTLANMRDHLEALSEILSKMSAGQYDKAAEVASDRLGMDSPSAEGCKGDASTDKPQMSKPAGMDHQMGQFMPEGMRNIGLAMHQAASEFAVEANKASKTGNPKQVLAALSKVTQRCTACHTAYRVR